MRKRQRCNINWSDLPQELLSQISAQLKPSHHLSNFRAVCKQWRASAPPSTHLLDPQFPRQIPPNPAIFKPSNSPIILLRTAVYLLQPLHQTSPTIAKPWFISVEELNLGKLRPRLPLTTTPIKHLPLSFPETLDLSGFRVSGIGDGFKLCFDDGVEDVFSIAGFCSNAIKVVYVNSTDNSHIGMIYALDIIGNLLCFELESGQLRSISINNGQCGIMFDDIVNFKGRVCGIDKKGRVYFIDVSKSSVVEVVVICGSIPTGCYLSSDRRKLLAELCGELYLIDRVCGEFFEVYKLDFVHNVWFKVDSLGDRILLVTFDGCFFVDAQMLPGFRGDCILFPKNRFPAYCSGWCYPDDVLFKGADKYLEIAVVYLNEGPSRGRLISSYSGLSDFFWPPPSWAKPRLPSFARILSGLYEQVKERYPCRLRYVSFLFA